MVEEAEDEEEVILEENNMEAEPQLGLKGGNREESVEGANAASGSGQAAETSPFPDEEQAGVLL